VANKIVTYGQKSPSKPLAAFSTLGSIANRPTINQPYRALQSTLGQSTLQGGNTLAGLIGSQLGSPDATDPRGPGRAPYALPAKPTTLAAPGGSTASAGTSAATGSTFDASTDPILMQLRAIIDRNAGDVGAWADAGKKQGLIAFGYDPALADLYPDADTAAAAQQNAASTLAQLLEGHHRNEIGIDQSRNLQNLFYSSTRSNDLGDEGKNYLFGRSGAQNALFQLLNNLEQEKLKTQQESESQWVAALQEAYNRWLATQPETGAPTGDPRIGDLGGAFRISAGPGAPSRPNLGSWTPPAVTPMRGASIQSNIYGPPASAPVSSTSKPKTVAGKKRIQ